MKDRILNVSSWIVLVGAILFSFYCVWKYAVDVPFMDEWGELPDLSLKWLLLPHNEHRIVFTKLLTNIFYIFGGWNIRANIIFNQFLYLGTVSALFLILKKYFYKIPIFPLFFVPFFSNLNLDNFLTAFQSQFHFMLLFGFLAVYFGLIKDKTIPFMVCIFCSMFSMNVAFASGIFAVYAIKKLYEKNYEILLTTSGVILVYLYMFFFLFKAFHTGEVLIYPWQVVFWDSISLYIGVVIGVPYILEVGRAVVFLLLLISGLIIYEDIKQKNLKWDICGLVVGILITLVAIFMFRGDYTLMSKTIRYNEILLVLFPIFLSKFYEVFFKSKSILLKSVFVFMLVWEAIFLSTNFSELNYKSFQRSKLTGLECIEKNYDNPKMPCSMLSPVDLKKNNDFQNAKKKRLHFIVEMEKKNER